MTSNGLVHACEILYFQLDHTSRKVPQPPQIPPATGDQVCKHTNRVGGLYTQTIAKENEGQTDLGESLGDKPQGYNTQKNKGTLSNGSQSYEGLICMANPCHRPLTNPGPTRSYPGRRSYGFLWQPPKTFG